MTDTPGHSSSQASSGRATGDGTISAPAPVVIADDTMTADAALAQLRGGATLLWRGDFHNGRQLLTAVDRRLAAGASPRKARHRRGKRTGRAGRPGTAVPTPPPGETLSAAQAAPTPPPSGHSPHSDSPVPTAAEAFVRQRADRAHRAGILNRIVVDLGVRPGSQGAEWALDLRRAPEVSAPCAHAYGPAGQVRRVALTELQGVLGAWQWHERGVEIAALGGDRVYPDYGVFSPTRSEYVDLVDGVASTHLPAGARVIELGTGTGVLAAVLIRRGAGRVIATDVNPRAVVCARRNVAQLGVGERVDVVEADLWPCGMVAEAGRTGFAGAADVADVVVFNPPWLPGTPTSELELGIYDADSDVLRRFLATLAEHLTATGEGWLVLSDLAEHLGLRTREELKQWIADGGLRILGRRDTAPRHPKATAGTSRTTTDPLLAARAQEVTSLWRLGVNPGPE